MTLPIAGMGGTTSVCPHQNAIVLSTLRGDELKWCPACDFFRWTKPDEKL